MIVATMTWTEPQDGSCTILFPDEAESDLGDLHEELLRLWGAEYGNTIPEISGIRTGVSGEPDAAPWEDMAATVRYTTGEELYDADIPVLARHGVARV